MLDDLDRPLGQDREPPPKSGRGRLIVGAVAVVLIAGVAAMVLSGKTRAPGGQAEAIAPIQPAPPPAPAPSPAPQQPQTKSPDGVATAEQVETESGVKIFRGGGAAPGAVIIQVPDNGPSPLAPAPDRRLVEKSRFGLLPKRGKDGATPADVYARPLSMQPAIKPGTPRIALLVGGMGLNAPATDEAIQRLPGAVSLAFAPYGSDLERQAAAAREAGHEILLQTPMEPFDSGDSPGPHTLQVGDGAKIVEDLHWQMGRFAGYIGLVNFLGGRFTADKAAAQALMRELGDRGLTYIDDGSSPQSLVGDAAAASGVRFGKADLRIDASRNPEAIDAALSRLESLARQNGVAIGFAAGLPETNERIARFAADLAKRGLVLVPVSAALGAASMTQSEKR